jgi:putative transcriptional regulator
MNRRHTKSAMLEDLMTGLDEVDAFLAGQTVGYKVSVPAEVDVRSIRNGLKMTQSRFSDTFGFSLDAVKHWEGGRRTPESSARAFLTVIAKNPRAVIEALHPHVQCKKHVQAAQGRIAALRPTRKGPGKRRNRAKNGATGLRSVPR